MVPKFSHGHNDVSPSFSKSRQAYLNITFSTVIGVEVNKSNEGVPEVAFAYFPLVSEECFGTVDSGSKNYLSTY
jgi:protein involved in ribonucleotide reduction